MAAPRDDWWADDPLLDDKTEDFWSSDPIFEEPKLSVGLDQVPRFGGYGGGTPPQRLAPTEPKLPKPDQPEASYLEIGRSVIESLPDRARRWWGGQIQQIGENPTLMTIPGDPLAAAMGFQNDPRLAEGAEGMAREGAEIYKAATDAIRAGQPNVDPDTLKGYVYDASVMFAEMAPMVAASLATRGRAGLPVMAEQVQAQQYGEARAEGMSPTAATAEAAYYALTETLTELPFLDALLKPGTNALVRIGKAMGIEGAGEMLNAAAQQSYEAAKIMNKTGADFAAAFDQTGGFEQIKRSGILGAAAGGAFGVVSDGIDAATRTDEAKAWAEEIDKVDVTKTGTQEAALAALDPRNYPKAPLTAEEVAGPLPNDLLAEGKAIVETVAATGRLPVIPTGDDDVPLTPSVNRRTPRDFMDEVIIPGLAENLAATAPVTETPPLPTPDEIASQPPAAPSGGPILRKDGTPWPTAAAAGLSSRTSKALKGQKLTPIQVEGGWALSPAQENVSEPASPGAEGQQPAGLGPSAAVAPPVAPVAGEAAGTRDAPAVITSARDMDTARQQVAAAPTDAQKEAGNYAKAHVKWNGLDVAIETAKGQERTGVDSDGERWAVTMPADYGYVKRTEGADGDQVDVYMGPDPQAQTVYVVDQQDAETGAFDEHKAMLGFNSKAEAVAAYDAGFSDGRGPERRAAVTAMTVEEFKAWAKSGDTAKPLAEAARTLARGAPTNAAAAAAARRRPQPEGGADAITFLATRGGLRDDEGHDLVKGRNLQRRSPAFGSLIRANGGMSIDQAGELLWDYGYFGPADTTPRPSENDVLNFIERAAKTKTYLPDIQAKKDQADADARARDESRDMMERVAESYGINPAGIPDAKLEKLLLDKQAEDADNAATEKQLVSDLEAELAGDDNAFEFKDAERDEGVPRARNQVDEDRGGPQAQQEAAQAGAEGREVGAQDDRDGQEPGRAVDDDIPFNIRRGATEKVQTVDGKRDQFVLPGAEQSAKQAQAARGEKLKPKVEQKAAGGMFAEPDKQGSLFNRRRVQTDSPAFKAWFGDSKVVDENGQPLVVYHGTQSEFDAFKPEREGVTTFIGIPVKVRRSGIFFAEDKAFAQSFADAGQGQDNKKGARIIAAYLSIKNPLNLGTNAATWRDQQKLISVGVDKKWVEDHLGDPRTTWESFEGDDAAWFVSKLKEAGYDGVYMNELDPTEVDGNAERAIWIAFEPTQIKSVDNRGTFDPKDPRISFAVARQAAPSKFKAAQALKGRLKQIDPTGRLSVELVERIDAMAEGRASEADGRYFRRLIEVAESAPDRTWTLNHEIIHGLRDLGVIKPAEWKALSDRAINDTLVMADGRRVNRLQEIRERYADLGLTEDQMIEEAVADMYADWAQGRVEAKGFVRAAFERIRAALKAMVARFREAGYTDVADILEGIERGYVGARGRQTFQGMRSPAQEAFAAAWHGTPHDFDEFSTDKIGTGEGAQVYGWGLYFAGKKGVADHYRRTLSRESEQTSYRGKAIAVMRDGKPSPITARDWPGHVESLIDIAIEAGASTPAEVRAAVEAANKNANWSSRAFGKAGAAKAFLDRFGSMGDGLAVIDARRGKLFKVELAPAEDEYLLWDKPLSEQSEKVKKALEKLKLPIDDATDLGDFGGQRIVGVARTGAETYKNLARKLGGERTLGSGASQYPVRYSDDRAASMALKEAGIRGIKYLDGQSRNRPLKEIKRAFLDALPEDAERADVMAMLGTGTFDAKQEAVIRELDKNDWLGFDYPAQAISAALGPTISNWDPTPELLAAVSDIKSDGTFNYVIFDDKDVRIEEKLNRRRAPVRNTETPAFKAWFGDSKVVDENGAPRPVYHSTDKRFQKFSKNKATMGGITWFTSNREAAEAGDVGAQGRGRILELYASIKNPASWEQYEKLGLGELKSRGYDGAILKNKDGSFDGFVFEPNQLKSVENRGTWSTDDDRLMFNRRRGTLASAIPADVERRAVAAYNDGLEPIKDQYTRWAAKQAGANWRKVTASDLVDTYGDDRSEWPPGVADIVDESGAAIEIARGNDVEYLPEDEAPTKDSFMSEIVEQEGGAFPAETLADIDYSQPGHVYEAFVVVAKADGWDVKGRDSKYFYLEKALPKGQEIRDDDGDIIEDAIKVGVRIADHARTSRVGHAIHGKSDVHINIAPSDGQHERQSIEEAVNLLRAARLDENGNLYFADQRAPLYNRRRGTLAQERAINKAIAAPDSRTIGQKIRDSFNVLRENAKDEMIWASADEFVGLLRLGQTVNPGAAVRELGSYVAARLARHSAGQIEAFLRFGAPQWDDQDAVLGLKPNTKGFASILAPLYDQGVDHLFDGYAYARRVDSQDLIAQGREHNLTDAEVADLLDLANTYPVLKQVFDEIQQFKKDFVDTAEAMGLINADQRKIWEQADHVPFYRVVEDGGVKGPASKRGLGNQSAGIKRLTGGEITYAVIDKDGNVLSRHETAGMAKLEAKKHKGATVEKAGQPIPGIIENVAKNFTHLLDAAMKNHAATLAIDEALAAGWAEQVPMEQTKALVPLGAMERALRDAGISVGPGATGVASVAAIRPPVHPGNNVIAIRRDGETEYYRVDDPLTLKALEGLHRTTNNAFVKNAAWFKGLLTHTVTSMPGFMVRNFVRDSGSAWLQSEDRSLNFWKEMARSVKALGTRMDDPKVKALMAAGGDTGWYQNAPEDMVKQLREMEKKGIAQVVTPGNLLKIWRRLGRASEMANRIAAYDATMRATGSARQAAFEAADLLDFQLKGGLPAMQFLNAVTPFLNARVQGLYKLGRVAGTSSKRARRAFAAKATMMIAFTMLLASINAGDDDDDGYNDLPEWIKDGSWVVNLKRMGIEGEDVPRMLFIPKPFELGVLFGTVPERMLQLAIGNDRPKDFAKSMTMAIWNTFAFNPLGNPVSNEIVQQVTNYDFFTGRPIVPESLSGLASADQFTSSTSEVAKSMGEATGVSPVRIEHFIRGFTGTLGLYMLAAGDAAARAMNVAPSRPEMRADEMEIVRSFIAQDPARGTKWVERFYDVRDQADDVFSSIRKRESMGKKESANKLLEENRALLGARPGLNKTADALAKISKAMGEVRRSDTLSPAQKREELDKLIAQRNKMAKDMARRAEARQ